MHFTRLKKKSVNREKNYQRILKKVIFSLKFDIFFLSWYSEYRAKGRMQNLNRIPRGIFNKIEDMTVLRPYVKVQ